MHTISCRHAQTARSQPPARPCPDHSRAGLRGGRIAPMPRPRFQFRLRTLFVVVTLFAIPCAYVGWQAKIARARKAFIESPAVMDATVDPRAEPPLLRKMLGDKSYMVITLRIAATRDEQTEAVAFFPGQRQVSNATAKARDFQRIRRYRRVRIGNHRGLLAWWCQRFDKSSVNWLRLRLDSAHPNSRSSDRPDSSAVIDHSLGQS